MFSALFGSLSCPIGSRSNYSRLQGNWRMKTRRSWILVWWVANTTATLNRLNSSVHKLVKFDMWPHSCSSWKYLCGLRALTREQKVGSLIFSYPVHLIIFTRVENSKNCPFERKFRPRGIEEFLVDAVVLIRATASFVSVSPLKGWKYTEFPGI